MRLKRNGHPCFLLTVTLLIIMGSGCAMFKKRPLLVPKEPGDTLVEITDPTLLPHFNDDYSRDSLLRSIDNSLDYFKRVKTNPYGFHMTGFSHENLEDSLKFFREGFLRCRDTEEINDFIIKNFRVFQAIGNAYEGQVHFTGYGTPIYDGSLTPTGEFRYPIYKMPSDFRKPYYTRREIEDRNLLKGLEIVYLKSKLDAYLIHVQGSGQIKLSSGEKVYVGYAADSGHKYNSIGRMLVMDGKIPEEELTLSTLISYFQQHPGELDSYLKKNDRFIFFKRVNYATPYGSIGVPVTPMRSIATDKKVFPAGGLAFAVIEPKKAKKTWKFWNKENSGTKKSFFVLDQDTGSAIQTPARADVYFGIGDQAMYEAGNLNTFGQLYYFLKR
ncbi:Membrane-bound lytic murein transglycosylase A precursor [Candidatus Brocadiaceae bacterium B188]|nr:MltA domain-containing protein [Candidatus Brocadia sapporoensis]QQR65564.1 MAG: MltA domain-containing protein [Candidatus Brocadia sp.]RZV57285.1 MAG: murein transglycosylase [Candidatus Brocadia sp. BROELEC01]TWU50472.1 Membrane-bound lytic murein transglycosylase A precursor [Candidatus Brocadiaceae bacterium B188]